MAVLISVLDRSEWRIASTVDSAALAMSVTLSLICLAWVLCSSAAAEIVTERSCNCARSALIFSKCSSDWRIPQVNYPVPRTIRSGVTMRSALSDGCPIVEQKAYSESRQNQVPLIHILKQIVYAGLHRKSGCIQHNLCSFRLLIRRINARKIFDIPCPRLLVQALWITGKGTEYNQACICKQLADLPIRRIFSTLSLSLKPRSRFRPWRTLSPSSRKVW